MIATVYTPLHKAADKLEDLADLAAADYARRNASHGADRASDSYARDIDGMLGGPVGNLAKVLTPAAARAIAAVIRRATGLRTPPAEVYTLADLILGED